MAKKARDKLVTVTVCTWDPKHTLQRVLAQEAAKADGTLAKLVKDAKGNKDALRSAMAKARLVSQGKSLNGDLHCSECGALMEHVFAAPGVTDRLAAFQDVAEDFTAAIDRTRRLRS